MSKVAVALKDDMGRSALLVLMLCAVACSSSKRIATVEIDASSRVSVHLEVTDYQGKKILDMDPTGREAIGVRLPNGKASYELPAEGKACITATAIYDRTTYLDADADGITRRHKVDGNVQLGPRPGFVRVRIFMKDPGKRTSANTAEGYEEGKSDVLIATVCVD